MKSIWKGSISFGLVNIPVKLYSSIEPKTFKMRMLHKKKLSPIRYKKWCNDCDKEVAFEDIVKGVEVNKDEYIILNEEELKSVKPEKSNRIEIVEIIASQQIDPIYFNSHYFVGPEQAKDKTYFLFREVLQQTAKTAIGRFVMREKEFVCAIQSYREGLLLTTLNYGDEIRPISKIDDLAEKPKISKVELDLAKQLINKIETNEFDIDKFEDSYKIELQKLVNKKAKGETIIISEPKREPRTKEENLIEVLKASLK